ncbi:hypothetical protein llap_9316 [Limosa lapponica baueri]|uniref:Uncharacterized protein n=1 Tax=Limosa lapponica baueri TaxID=1758121 RepID=A0A2I0U305_LIMLA|nr:hypothetical protein llap_9316 [Limosa lapponica baueri]
MVRQAVPLQPMEINGGADVHLQPVEDPTPEWVDIPEGGCDPMWTSCWIRLLAGSVEREAHAGAGLLAGLLNLRWTHIGEEDGE